MTTMITEQQLLDRFAHKKKWEVKKAHTASHETPPEFIRRFLELRNLELVVRDGIDQALNAGLLPETLTEVYETFIADENKHYEQLGHLAAYYGLPEQPEESEFSKRLDAMNPHPLVANFMLEQVFIVSLPQIQKLGNPFANYVASWILLDEAQHVLFGRYYLQRNGIVIPSALVDFVMDILGYLFESDSGALKKARATLIRNIKDGAYTGEETLVIPPRVSFFEVPRESIVY